MVRRWKHKNPKIEDISWEEFEKTLKKRKLSVYKAENGDFLKIMRDRRQPGMRRSQ